MSHPPTMLKNLHFLLCIQDLPRGEGGEARGGLGLCKINLNPLHINEQVRTLGPLTALTPSTTCHQPTMCQGGAVKPKMNDGLPRRAGLFLSQDLRHVAG